MTTKHGIFILAATIGAASFGCGNQSGSQGTTFLEWLNERGRSGAVTDTLHGVEVADPYRLLEEDTPTTSAWVEGQTARSEGLLEPHITDERRERVGALMSIGVLGGSRVAGDRIFFERREGEQEQPVLMVRETADDAAAARVLLDPTELGPRVAIDWYYPSPTGRFVAIGLSTNGDERSVLRILDVTQASETNEEERIPNCKWSTVSWLNDESGFYYTRYPREGEPNYNAEEPDSYFPRIFFHSIGTDQAADPLVFGAEDPEDFPSPSVSDDDRYLVINLMQGWSSSDVLLLDRTAEGAEPVAVSEDCECLIHGAVRHGRLFLYTNEDHPRYRLMAVDPAQAGDQSQWTEIIPESDEAVLEGFGVTTDRLVLYEMRNYAGRIRIATLDGEPAGELELPTNGSVRGLSTQTSSNRIAFAFSSFFYPPTLFSADVAAATTEQLEQVETDMDIDQFQVTQETATSEDGTEINVFLVHRRDATPDGTNRVLLYGYGGFNISILPSFSRRALYWLEQGGVYAVANLRGGGELGEEWHQAGQLEHKHHVFEDFEAVIRWLSTSNWSTPERIAILGGSNGGLLVGATLNRCPEAFGAAVGYVGLYDMLRYHRFPPAELWVSEYGSADDAEQFTYLREYSPYHNIRPGTAYPPTLIETADHDSRVYWGHSTKFTARLQEASTDPESILFYMDRSVGHGAGTGRSDAIDQIVRMYAFLAWRIGDE